jgi:hypothetical protein
MGFMVLPRGGFFLNATVTKHTKVVKESLSRFDKHIVGVDVNVYR